MKAEIVEDRNGEMNRTVGVFDKRLYAMRYDGHYPLLWWLVDDTGAPSTRAHYEAENALDLALRARREATS